MKVVVVEGMGVGRMGIRVWGNVEGGLQGVVGVGGIGFVFGREWSGFLVEGCVGFQCGECVCVCVDRIVFVCYCFDWVVVVVGCSGYYFFGVEVCCYSCYCFGCVYFFYLILFMVFWFRVLSFEL